MGCLGGSAGHLPWAQVEPLIWVPLSSESAFLAPSAPPPPHLYSLLTLSNIFFFKEEF